MTGSPDVKLPGDMVDGLIAGWGVLGVFVAPPAVLLGAAGGTVAGAAEVAMGLNFALSEIGLENPLPGVSCGMTGFELAELEPTLPGGIWVGPAPFGATSEELVPKVGALSDGESGLLVEPAEVGMEERLPDFNVGPREGLSGLPVGTQVLTGLEDGDPGLTVGASAGIPVVGLLDGDPGLMVGTPVVGSAEGNPRLTVGPAEVGPEEGLPGLTVGTPVVGVEDGDPGLTVGASVGVPVVGLLDGDPGLTVGTPVVGLAEGDPGLIVGPAEVGLEEGLPGLTVGTPVGLEDGDPGLTVGLPVGIELLPAGFSVSTMLVGGDALSGVLCSDS